MYSIVLAVALTAGGESTKFSGVYFSRGCWGCDGGVGYHGGWGCGYSSWGCGHGWYGMWGGTGCSGVVIFGSCCGVFPPLQHHNEHLFLRPPPLLAPEPKLEEKLPPPEKKVTPGQALLKVDVEADARLYINGRLMRTTSAHRAFDTPALEK